MHVNDLLKIAVDKGASDLHLKVGSYPMMRVHGSLVAASRRQAARSRGHRRDGARRSCRPRSAEKFKDAQEVDLAYSVPGLGRFRCNVFQQRGTIGLVLRVIPIADHDRSTSSACRRCSRRSPTEERGLVLVTGTTGSGKSTTLAAMIDHINATRAAHVMTIEDPIEFLHRDNQSIVNQREVGVDTRSFAHALRSALRQDPDVILVGEMRDFETIETGAARRRDRPPGVLDAAHARRHRDHQPHHLGVPAAPAEAGPPAAGERAQGGRLAAPDAARRRHGPRAGGRGA